MLLFTFINEFYLVTDKYRIAKYGIIWQMNELINECMNIWTNNLSVTNDNNGLANKELSTRKPATKVVCK